MSEETSRGRATKDAFAKALMERMRAGEEYADISIRMLAEDCGVDRQTFYYHFKNMQSLAEYAYEREVEIVLNMDEVKANENADWRTRTRSFINAIGQTSEFKYCIEPLINLGLLWTSIAHRVELNLHRDFDEKLDAYNIDETERNFSLQCLSFAIASIYVAWTRHQIEGTVDDVVNAIEHMRNDYLGGVARRYTP